MLNGYGLAKELTVVGSPAKNEQNQKAKITPCLVFIFFQVSGGGLVGEEVFSLA